MGVSSAVRNIVDKTRSFGPRAAFHDLQCLAINQFMDFKILEGMTAVLDDVDPRMLEAPGYQARFAERDELLAATERPEVAAEMNADFVQAALDRGDECFALFDGDQLASFGWYARQPTPIGKDLTIHFDPSWVYMYKGYTLPDHRGKRLHGIGMSMALQAYTERGAHGLISYVKSTNFRSLRSIERMGYRIFGEVYIARARGRTRTWSTPGCRPYGFRVEYSPAMN